MSWKSLLVASEWRSKLYNFMEEKYAGIIEQLKKVSENRITPGREDMFNAFNLCDLNQVRIVLIGQDPYHSRKKSGHRVAHGLSFSYLNESESDTFIPPSLENIFKEIKKTVYSNDDSKVHKDFYNTNLTRWAKQNVLLLNVALTAEYGIANKHTVYWSSFSQKVLKLLNDKTDPICIILLGSEAKKYSEYFDVSKHKILKAGHPSPLNSNNDFLDSGVFEEARKWLKITYNQDIIW